MALVVIDDKKINAAEGKTIIEAAFENGIDVPHFCWHPELSVSGNCRMCLVEVGSVKKDSGGNVELDASGEPIINYFPKLQIACATKISDGMYVRTKSEQVVKAQESVMEFLLINHPLDCPICDEAGQCKLQDYAFNHSKGESRFIEEKNNKPKRQSWGPNVIYDAERCISCSRCIRFAQEYAEQDVLTFVNRGDKVTIKVEEGKEFDNNYSMNVIDICPVGALTSKDFRFQARVWDMSFNDSICTGCSKGCNIKIGVRNNKILRIEPRANQAVNKFWSCDYGRLNYEHFNNNRLTAPLVKENGALNETDWKTAYTKAAELLKKYHPNQILFIASPNSVNEDNYLFAKFAKSIIKTHNITYLDYTDEGFADNKLKTKDKSPNSFGAKIFSGTSAPINYKEIEKRIKDHQIKLIYILDDMLPDNSELFPLLKNCESVIAHSINKGKITEYADIIFASSALVEVEGSLTNIDKRVQYLSPALVTAENSRNMGMKMSRLDKFGADNDRWTQNEKRDTRQGWRIIMNIANQFSAGWNYLNSGEVFEEISEKTPEFKAMNYSMLKEYQGVIWGGASTAKAPGRVYESHYFKP